MSVLLIRLKGPMQSWGSRSRFSLRTTEPYPTKSGVIGMIAAALGMARTEPLDRFRGLRFGVRVDQPGLLLDDFHTAHNDAGESMPLSHRHYLSDAVFLAALEDPGGDTRLREYADALAAPHFPLFLGRRSCPPDGPIATWIVDGSLEDALRSAPWQATEFHQRRCLRNARRFPNRLEAEIFVESPDAATNDPDTFILNDSPQSFDPRGRLWTERTVVRLRAVRPRPTVEVPTSPDAPSPGNRRQYRDTDFPADTHDPMTAILSAPVEADATSDKEAEA